MPFVLAGLRVVKIGLFEEKKHVPANFFSLNRLSRLNRNAEATWSNVNSAKTLIE